MPLFHRWENWVLECLSSWTKLDWDPGLLTSNSGSFVFPREETSLAFYEGTSTIRKEKTLNIFVFSLLKFMPRLDCGGIKADHIIIYRLRLFKVGFRVLTENSGEYSGVERVWRGISQLPKARWFCLQRAEGPEHFLELCHLFCVSYLASEWYSLITLIYLKLGQATED